MANKACRSGVVNSQHIVSISIVVLMATMLQGQALSSDTGNTIAAEVTELLKDLDDAEITFGAAEPCNSEKNTRVFHKFLKENQQKAEARSLLPNPAAYSDTPVRNGLPAFVLSIDFKTDKKDVYFSFQLDLNSCVTVNATYGVEPRKVTTWFLSKAGAARLSKFYAAERDVAAEIKEFLKEFGKPEIVLFKADQHDNDRWNEAVPKEAAERADKKLNEKKLTNERTNEEIRIALTDPKTYALFSGTNRFNFKPEFGFRFTDGTRTAELVVSPASRAIEGYRPKHWIDVRGGRHEFIESKIWELSQEGTDQLTKIFNEMTAERKSDTPTELKQDAQK